MNNIYKRQPIVHKLPTDYSDLDNIKFFNLNNIQGLQCYDNPIAAEQNSTYSCKNTYRDELGNLTVRPAIWYDSSKSNINLDAKIHWYFDTQFNKKIYLTSENDYDVLNIGTEFQHNIIKNSRVAVQETADATYILFQDNTVNNLQFWKYDGETFTECTGEIQIFDFSKPNLGLYNILNNKVLSRSYELPIGIHSEEQFVLTSEYTVLDETAIKTFQLKNNNFLVITPSKIYYLRYINYQWYKYEYTEDNYNFKDSYLYHVNIEDYSDDDIIYINVTAQESASGTRIYYYRFKLSLGIGLACSDTCSSILSGEFIFRPLYNGYWLSTETVDSATTVRLHLCSDGGDSTADSWEMLITIISSFIAATKIIYTEKSYAIAVPHSSGLNYGVQGKTYNQTADETVHTIDYSFGKSYGGGEFQNSAIIEINSLDYAAFYDYALGEIHILSKDLVLLSNNVGTLIEINSKDYIIPTDYGFIPAKSQVIGNTLNLVVNNVSVTTIYHIILNNNNTVTNSYSFTGNYYSAAINDAGTILFLDNGDIVFRTRSVKPIDTPVDRPDNDIIAGANNIPVLSQFKENVITSFYLDGFYWFVTEHRVFGTGAANGSLTIEFFDPLKYFAFTESLTAAIRISDTSFWLFHNSGAYLIYKATFNTSESTEYRWMCTNTPKSKGCDFENAVITLPVTSTIAVVTAEDICSVEMKENIQSDDRSLVPMTLNFRNSIRELLEHTSDIVIATYHYLTIFFLNKETEDGTVPAVVYDSTINSWWYWEIPAQRVYQATQTETNVDLLLKISDNAAGIYGLSEDKFLYQIGTIQYEIYSDRLYIFDGDTFNLVPKQIDWSWESAVLLFGTVDYRKQLLFTTFVFDDYHEPNNTLLDLSYVNFEFYFKIYSKRYATTTPQVTTSNVERVNNNACRTMVANFNYLQLVLQNRSFENDSYEALTKPKICSISLKYRILRGTLT